MGLMSVGRDGRVLKMLSRGNKTADQTNIAGTTRQILITQRIAGILT